MDIYVFDARAGAGKTRALTHYAHRLAGSQSQKVLFVQPTTNLITNTIAEELQPLEPLYPVHAIHSGNRDAGGSVVGSIVAHFKNAVPGRGEVLFITHAAFLRLPYIERKADWYLIMDEVPQVDVFEELPLSKTHHLITSALELVPTGAVYGRLVAAEDALAAREAA